MYSDLLKLEELVMKKNDLETLIKEQNELICEKYCEVKIGDEVTANGYSYSGKIIVASRIELARDQRGLHFIIHGQLKNKNGELSLNSGERIIIIDKNSMTIVK